jgi:hypothetical protein
VLARIHYGVEMLGVEVVRRCEHDEVDFLRFRHLTKCLRSPEHLSARNARVALTFGNRIVVLLGAVQLISEQVAERGDSRVGVIHERIRHVPAAVAATK